MFFVYKIVLIILSIMLLPVILTAFLLKPKFQAGFWEKIGISTQQSDKKFKLSLLNMSTVIFFLRIFISLWEKFGFCKEILKKKSIWVHAVSVGEINATEGLIKRIKSELPAYKLVVTTVTATGQEVANKKLGDVADVISYFPYDFSFSIKSALKAFNPALIVIAETEIWPNFVDQTSKRGIPVMLVNGRISPGSFKGYRKLRFFFSKILKKFSLILMQTETDRERIVKIGAPAEITEVMGNLKFDITGGIDDNAVQELKDSLQVGDNRVLIAGSTHQGEDEIVLNVYKKLKQEFQDLKLLLAPRHPERNEDVLELINSSGHKHGLRSAKQGFGGADVILLDTMGELGQLYGVSHLAFIGGSFSGTGGHNPLEAAIYGVPVVSGSTVFNFKDIYNAMTETGAAKLVNSEDELYLQLKDYLVIPKQKGFSEMRSGNEDFSLVPLEKPQRVEESSISENRNTNSLPTCYNYNRASRACLEIFEKNRGALDFAIQKIKKYL